MSPLTASLPTGDLLVSVFLYLPPRGDNSSDYRNQEILRQFLLLNKVSSVFFVCPSQLIVTLIGISSSPIRRLVLCIWKFPAGTRAIDVPIW